MRTSPSRRIAVQRVAIAGALTCALFALTYVPYWHGLETFDSMRNAPGNHFTSNSMSDMLLTELRWSRYRREHPDYNPARYTGSDRAPNSPDSLISDSFDPMIAEWRDTRRLDWSLMPERPYRGLENALRLFNAALLVIVWLYWALRVRDLDTMIRAWGWSFFTYATFTAMWFWPWYLVWFVGIAALSGWDRLGKTGAILGVSGSMVYFGAYFGGWGYHARSLLTFLPPLGYLAWSAWTARRQSAAAPQ
jgi:hypothetical protein